MRPNSTGRNVKVAVGLLLAAACLALQFSFFRQVDDHSRQAALDEDTLTVLLKEKLTPSAHRASSSSAPPRIPHRLIFTYKYDILKQQSPKHIIYDNIMHTVDSYRQFWNDAKAPIWFLSDQDCRDALEQTEPRLVRHFQQEVFGAYKADLCRVAALYLQGGYYFDVDIQVIEPVLIPNNVGFSSVLESGGKGFFQSFLASEPKSPILKDALRAMLEYYEEMEEMHRNVFNSSIPVETILNMYGPRIIPRGSNNNDDRSDLWKTIHEHMGATVGWMGVRTLKEAYDNILQNSSGIVGPTLILREVNLAGPMIFPNLARQVGKGCCCNYAVRDDERPYFWSRMVGATENCMSI